MLALSARVYVLSIELCQCQVLPNASELSQASGDIRRVTSNSLGFSASAVLQLPNLRLSDIVLGLVWQKCLLFTSLNQRKDTSSQTVGVVILCQQNRRPIILRLCGYERLMVCIDQNMDFEVCWSTGFKLLRMGSSNPHLRSSPA